MLMTATLPRYTPKVCAALESASAAASVICSPATTVGKQGGVMPALRAAILPAALSSGTYSSASELAVR